MELLQRISRGWPMIQFLATILGTLNTISSGLIYGWTSPSLPILFANDSAIPLTSGEGSTLASIVVLGSLSGCILAGALNNRIGRKILILLSCILALISWIFIAFAKSVEVLIIGRYLGGMAEGLNFCVVGVYVSEIAQPKYRGHLGSYIGLTYSIGHLLINIIGSRVSITDAALISALFPIISLLTFYWMPESPYYLLMKKKVEDAKRSIGIFNGSDDCTDDFARIAQGIEELTSGSCLDLVRIPSNRKTLILVITLRAIQQASGETIILFYAQTIFSGVQDISPDNCAIIYLSIELVGLLLSTVLIDRVGRKPLLITSLVGCALALFSVALYFYIHNQTSLDTTRLSWVPVFALAVYIVMFGIGLQTIPLSIGCELFPTNMKGYGICANGICFSIIAGVLVKYFQITKDEVGLEVPFVTFSACCVLGAIIVAIFVPETKNKTLEQIQLELKSSSSRL